MTTERFGPLLLERGVRFRLWAPTAKQAELILDRPMPMDAAGGWFTCDIADARSGTRYQFRIDGELTIADPASRFQPDDVNGPSEVIEHRYEWARRDWKGRPWHEAVILELHVGTFTSEGTFRAAIDKLDRLVETGITAIELMPLADFVGRWNWGYDGVLLFAPDSSYGRPEDLKALIDAAHQRGLMVFLDVVYNHFGPDGNYLPRIAPQFFSEAHTPWGVAVNYSAPEVRAFAIENALMWVRDYRFDGLRLDAVHAIVNPGDPHILDDLSRAIGDYATESGRHIHLILENDDNRISLLDPAQDPPQGRYRAQWNDDYHHAWHVELTGEHNGYYKDYLDSAGRIARCLAEGFCYQGEGSLHRNGQARGEPSENLSPLAFVNFLQNHDQIGNRARGERLSALAAGPALEAALAVLLLSPSPPLLFMGEEWGSKRPFPFFCDFKGELAEAVRKGRREEFADAYAESGDSVPDPLAETTILSARLDWENAAQGPHAERLELTKRLLQTRRRHIMPLLPDILPGRAKASFENGLLQAQWSTNDRTLALFANFSDRQRDVVLPSTDTVVWGERAGRIMPWSVFAGIGAA
jgi:maltooligosyltrehalose trehalohydrolase